MNLFKKLITDNTPFAVIKYNEWLISGKDNVSVSYELIKADILKEKPFSMDGKLICNTRNIINGRVLNASQIEYFKSIQHKFTKVISTSYGAVWEINNFKKHTIKLNIKI